MLVIPSLCPYNNKKPAAMPSLKTVYLVAYNGAMFVGWSCVLGKMVYHLVTHSADPKEALNTLYPVIQGGLVIFQTGAVAEIFHSLFGLVRSPFFTTFAQVLSRLLVLWGTLEIGDTNIRRSPFLVSMLTAWCCSEMIRYSFYVFNLTTGQPPSFLKWLRYSAFTILYPLGISGEVVAMYTTIPFVHKTGRWVTELPNTMNISFNWAYTMWFILICLYPPASKLLYGHMLNQRRKVLGAAQPKRD